MTAIRVEIGDMPLRREKLTMMYWVNLQGCIKSHRTRAILNDCWEYKKKNENRFGWKDKHWVKKFGLENVFICPNMPLTGVSCGIFLNLMLK